MPPSDQQGGSGGPGGGGERPDYKVYRSRPGLLSRLRTPDVGSLRDRLRRKPKPDDERPKPAAPEPARKRRWLGWVLLAALAWLLISLLAFAVSAQIQKSKLAGNVGDKLDGNPFLAVSPQNILVLGTDVRAPEFAAENEQAAKKCYEAASQGKNPPATCEPYRADTIMVIRAGAATFRKLSIPRDSVAEIPGQGVGRINAAYASGGAALQVRTVERFLDIEIDHVAIVDFRGFREFIDALGGIEVDLDEPVCSEISGGAEGGGITLDLDAGENDLDGLEALSLARTRMAGDCDGDGAPDSSFDDLDRVRFQQEVIDGIKGRLTSPWRLPYNFIKGPFIGWNAPKALVSDMGALTMPQLMVPAIFGGGGDTQILEPAGNDPSGGLIIPEEERRRAVDKLLEG